MSGRPLNVVVQGTDEASRAERARAALEVFVRIGAPFSLHRDFSSTDEHAHVLYYGPPEAQPHRGTVARRIQLLPWSPLPLSHCCKVVSKEGLTLWGAPSAEGETPDLLAGAASLLSFAHEAGIPAEALDKFGRIPPENHPFHKLDLFRTPLLENAALAIRRWCGANGVDTNHARSPWPGQVPVVVTHDVDGPFLHRPFALARSAFYGLLRGNVKERHALEAGLIGLLSGGEDPYFSFLDWQRLERWFAATSTFFVYPRGAVRGKTAFNDPHYRLGDGDLRPHLRRLVDSGWTVGLHSSIGARKCPEYAASVGLLERTFDTKVDFVRAHYWSIDWSNPYQSWKEMAEAGLKADTSLNPMCVGLRNGTCLPIQVSTAWSGLSGNNFFAIPTTVMDEYEVNASRREAAAGISQSLSNLVSSIRSLNGLLVLDWHERTLSNLGPWKGFFSRLLELLELLKSSPEFTFMSLSEMLAKWQAHVSQVFVGEL